MSAHHAESPATNAGANRSFGRTWILLFMWAVLVVTGVCASAYYAATPADTRESSSSWPAATSLSLDSTCPTLVAFFHPHCPCSRASFAELSKVIANCNGKVTVNFVFVRPTGVPVGWEQSELWQDAVRISGVTVIADENGDQAERFGATTSGEVFLYTPQGERLFQGGMTWARGHEGDSVGNNAVQELILTGHAAHSSAPVFGCALQDN